MVFVLLILLRFVANAYVKEMLFGLEMSGNNHNLSHPFKVPRTPG